MGPPRDDRDSGDYSEIFPTIGTPSELQRALRAQAGRIVAIERGQDMMALQIERLEEELTAAVDAARELTAKINELVKTMTEHYGEVRGIRLENRVAFAVLIVVVAALLRFR